VPAVPVVAPIFTSITGTSFYFNGSAATQADAQAACLAAGGHLATYATMEQQAEVEQHYVATGHLLPACQRAYWLGYKYAGVWPDFRCGHTLQWPASAGMPPVSAVRCPGCCKVTAWRPACCCGLCSKHTMHLMSPSHMQLKLLLQMPNHTAVEFYQQNPPLLAPPQSH
jgi:hypothetical protein